jgi:hypothetical protein
MSEDANFEELRALLTQAVQGPAEDVTAYVQVLRNLDAWKDGETASLLSWDLRHYLSNRSYAKALLYLETQGKIG